MTDQHNTPEGISEHDTSGRNALLDSYLMIYHALELQPNSSHYRQLKQRMTPEEILVLQYMQKHLSHKKHTANKQEGQVPVNNRGRKKHKNEAPVVNDSTATNAEDTEIPPSYPS